jgi:hypothetical protein
MSIRFVYTPRFVGVALNAAKQTLAMVRNASVFRNHYNANATRSQKSLTENSAIGSFGTPFDYYISTTGNNSDAGTLGAPWAISALWTKADATLDNKSIGLLDGTYIITGITSSGNNTGGYSITADNLTVKAVNRHLAIITTNNGGTYPQATDPVFQVIGTGITFDGIRWQEFGHDPIRVTGDDTTIINNDFYDVDLDRSGHPAPGDNVGFIYTASSAYPANLVIENNRFNQAWNGSSSHNGACIGPLYYAGSTTIRNNSFYNAQVAIYWKGLNQGPLVIEGNYFDSTIVESGARGVMTQGSSGVFPLVLTFTNNVLNRTGIMTTGGQDNEARSEAHSNIQFNTFVMASDADIYGYQGIGYSIDESGTKLSGANLNGSTLRNNVFYSVSGSSPILYRYNNASRNTYTEIFGEIDYNLYSRIDVQDGASNHTTIAAWRTALAVAGVTGREANSQVATPTMSNSSANSPLGYVLSTGSAGENDASDGTDLGAYGGGNTQVGPTWEFAAA